MHILSISLLTILVTVPLVMSVNVQGSRKPLLTNNIPTDYKDKLNTQMRLKMLKTLAKRRTDTTQTRYLLSTRGLEDLEYISDSNADKEYVSSLEENATGSMAFPDRVDLQISGDMESIEYTTGQPDISGRRLLQDMDIEQTTVESNVTTTPESDVTTTPSSPDVTTTPSPAMVAIADALAEALAKALAERAAMMTTTPTPDDGFWNTGTLVALIGSGAGVLGILGVVGGVRYTKKHHTTINHNYVKSPDKQDNSTEPLVQKTRLNVQGFLEFPTINKERV
jgi:hypothetical protein